MVIDGVQAGTEHPDVGFVKPRDPMWLSTLKAMDAEREATPPLM
jgi:hypothetical protein